MKIYRIAVFVLTAAAFLAGGAIAYAQPVKQKVMMSPQMIDAKFEIFATEPDFCIPGAEPDDPKINERIEDFRHALINVRLLREAEMYKNSKFCEAPPLGSPRERACTASGINRITYDGALSILRSKYRYHPDLVSDPDTPCCQLVCPMSDDVAMAVAKADFVNRLSHHDLYFFYHGRPKPYPESPLPSIFGVWQRCVEWLLITDENLKEKLEEDNEDSSLCKWIYQRMIRVPEIIMKAGSKRKPDPKPDCRIVCEK